MTTIRVTNIHDDKLKLFSGLTNHQLRNRLDPARGVCIVESETAIRVAVEEGVEVLALLLDERKFEAMGDVLGGLGDDVPVYVLPPEEAEKLTGYRVTRGALCAVRRPPGRDARTTLADARHVVVLEGMTDASNVGATFRNAAALDADVVVVAPTCADPLCRRAVRVSMGNVFRVPWVRAEDPWPHATMTTLRELGFASYALALTRDARTLQEVAGTRDARRALFLGAEGPGLSRKVLQSCDASVIIPMSRGVDSLNVAAAGAVAMWALFSDDVRG